MAFSSSAPSSLGCQTHRGQAAQGLERPHGRDRGQVEGRLRPPAEAVRHILLRNDRLDSVHPERPFFVDVSLEEAHGLLRRVGLEEADFLEGLRLESGVLIDHVLLEPAIDGRGLNAQRVSQEIRGAAAVCARIVILDRLVRRPSVPVGPGCWPTASGQVSCNLGA